MNRKIIHVLSLLVFASCASFSQNENPGDTTPTPATVQSEIVQSEPHQYGGWFCPDNLNGFPPVNIKNWHSVPVISGRLPTREETQTEASLIFVDPIKYPNASAIDVRLPALASIYNRQVDRTDLVIIIQAIRVGTDSIVGYRFLNGGNGSARLSEVTFLTDAEIAREADAKFVEHSVVIEARPDEIWDVLTLAENLSSLEKVFDPEKKLAKNWREKANVNFRYNRAGKETAAYAGKLFGNYYIQNDYDRADYNEKILLLEQESTNQTEVKIVTGPFVDDYEAQKNIVQAWAAEVKALSEGR